MNLIIGLAAVDEASGGQQMRQLAAGWMHREESRAARRVRTTAADALTWLAARLRPRMDMGVEAPQTADSPS